MAKKPVVLVIMDGYAISKQEKGNAIFAANNKNLKNLLNEYPNSTLVAHGEEVGLPEGQMGNSEVGHLNLGAGRVVYQNLTRINMSIREDKLKDEKVIKDAIATAKEGNNRVHVLGLLSDGGVHSHINHIKELLKISENNNCETYLHAFTDGRDVGPKTSLKFVKDILDNNHKIATVSGRYYAMDRDSNYERTKFVTDVMFKGLGEVFESPLEGISKSHELNILDEFVLPFVSNKDGIIKDGDVIIFANFRPDRAIQIATAISNPSKINYDNNIKTTLKTMTKYGDSVKGDIVFGLTTIKNTLGDIISEKGLNQLRIAETEKYAHVTFFFDGGVDKEIEGSNRVLVASPKVATYDLKPEMSAYEVYEKLEIELEKDLYELVILNFANCDMVGHTGIMDATIKAVEVVDELVYKVHELVKAKDGVCLITADHGNAEKLLDEDCKVFTAHTTNEVPLIITSNKYNLKSGALCDVAPTILELLNIKQPSEMTGKSLIEKK